MADALQVRTKLCELYGADACMKGVARTKLYKLYIADAVCIVDAVRIVYTVVRC